MQFVELKHGRIWGDKNKEIQVFVKGILNGILHIGTVNVKYKQKLKGAVRRKNSLSKFWYYLEVLLKNRKIAFSLGCKDILVFKKCKWGTLWRHLLH